MQFNNGIKLTLALLYHHFQFKITDNLDPNQKSIMVVASRHCPTLTLN